METFKDRLRIIINTYYNGNKSWFARETKNAQTTINSLVNGSKGKPSSDTMEKILNAKSVKINPTWLITGQGSMILEDNYAGVSLEVEEADKQELEIENKYLKKTNQELKDQLRKITEEYGAMKYRLEQLDKKKE